MKNTLPAILIGGPPHAGKSVLFYSISRALHERGIRHHAIRACPDGEGNWSQESDADIVSHVRSKGAWSDEFVQRICHDLEHRCLPFLVDMGGHPQESQACMLGLCTHSILLLRNDRPEHTQLWQRLCTENDLTPLASITSQLDGENAITAQAPVLEGTLSNLERKQQFTVSGPLFDALIERIVVLFKAAAPDELEETYREMAPAQWCNLYTALSAIDPATNWWRPEMLPVLLKSLSATTSLAVYGKAPNWIYAGLAAHTDPQPFYQFDPRRPFGWIRPLPVRIADKEKFPEIEVHVQPWQDATVLMLNIRSKHLEYFQSESLPFPEVAKDAGLILHGVIPFWLLTALVRLYKEAGVAWIAPYYVQTNSAIVAYSRVASYQPGDSITLVSRLVEESL